MKVMLYNLEEIGEVDIIKDSNYIEDGAEYYITTCGRIVSWNDGENSWVNCGFTNDFIEDLKMEQVEQM